MGCDWRAVDVVCAGGCWLWDCGSSWFWHVVGFGTFVKCMKSLTRPLIV